MAINKIIIEIPKNSNIKYEYDIKTNKIAVDRILKGSNVYPENYGFIPNTLDYDGDPLDIVLISNFKIYPGIEVDAKIIGVLYMEDQGEIDNKLIGVIDGDSDYNGIDNINDIEKSRLNRIEDFFKNYKLLENKPVVIKGFGNKDKAEHIYKECMDLYKKNKDDIYKLSKKDLVKKIS